MAETRGQAACASEKGNPAKAAKTVTVGSAGATGVRSRPGLSGKGQLALVMEMWGGKTVDHGEGLGWVRTM